ncbi:F-box protein At5g07610-like [Aegilops tauschii subsp. strangulata]|uniref:Uncharacterized protein n=1 Tax=Aegilops tauschii subsp. strangulata TaxID=200361 RepID=A0A453MYR2_AEGTS|nr:uncharacterized protein LOC120967327 [Aegilops tauschii subsp. strangulata]
MTASRRRRRAPLPVAGPLEDDDLLSEILLRLPPEPSSLPRASAVCKRWLLLVSDPGFVRRFRRHHRHSPPLIGCFTHDPKGISFTPSMDSPDRVPAGRFSLQLDHRLLCSVLGCCHGLVLISNKWKRRVIVWDPVTGDQHHIAIPHWFNVIANPIQGAVLRAADEDHHFQVVLLEADDQNTRAIVCVYCSETGLWGNIIFTSIPSKEYRNLYSYYTMSLLGMPAVLVGNSLYWRLAVGSYTILEFDLERQSLGVIQVPVDISEAKIDFTLMRAEGGGLGLLSVSGFTAKLWKRKTDYDGIASWGMGRTVELDKLLSLNSEKERRRPLRVIGFAEENNVVILLAADGVFTVQLESLQFRKLDVPSNRVHHHPFESVYARGT